MLISIAVMLSSCAKTPRVETSSAPTFWCQTNTPTSPTASQYGTFSHQQKVDMLAHNSFGKKWCGWKP